jgi:hypothetical protein
VAVDRSREYLRVEVTIARLKNRQLPPTRVFVTAQPFDDVLLDNVIEARAPGHRRCSSAPQGLAEDQIDEQLPFWATALTEVAEDFLQGSLDALEDGERAVRDRMAGRRHRSQSGCHTTRQIKTQRRRRDGHARLSPLTSRWSSGVVVSLAESQSASADLRIDRAPGVSSRPSCCWVRPAWRKPALVGDRTTLDRSRSVSL